MQERFDRVLLQFTIENRQSRVQILRCALIGDSDSLEDRDRIEARTSSEGRNRHRIHFTGDVGAGTQCTVWCDCYWGASNPIHSVVGTLLKQHLQATREDLTGVLVKLGIVKE